MTETPSISGPLDLDALFEAPFAPFKRVVLAVSGGPDSMALMVLVARWLAQRESSLRPAPAVDVATVDHGLRLHSAEEAAWIAEQAHALGLAHATLAWSGDKPAAGVQEQARAARYALLAAHARTDAPAAVVTAHTADDQAETLLMRLGRGSGVDGLAGMSPSRPLLPDGSVRLVRPLLAVAKSDLVAVLTSADAAWLHDPSNDRPDFERVRLRQACEHAEALGLSNAALARSAARLLRAREALDTIAQTRLADLVHLHDGVFASFSRDAWCREPAEIRVRMLARLLAAFGGSARPARLSQVEALDEALVRDDHLLAQTLGGCIVSKGRTNVRVYRELSAPLPAETLLLPGQELLWDWRFRLTYERAGGPGEAPSPPVAVRALGLAAYATLRGRFALKDRPPARAAAGLPSIWRADTLLAVPPLAGGLAGDGRFHAVFVGLGRDLR